MILFLCVYLRHIIKQTKVMRKKNNRKNVPIDAHVPPDFVIAYPKILHQRV